MLGNLFANLPVGMPEEIIDVIVETRGCRVERIVSDGHASAEGFWYDQDEDEWVIVLSGAARIGFEDGAAPVELRVGDHVHIPAHQRHRVEWTTSEEPTVWLAVFLETSGVIRPAGESG